MRKVVITVLAASALAFSAVCLAGPGGFDGAAKGNGPQGFSAAAPNSVAAVRSSGYDDQMVTLQGRLTEYLGHDKYQFTDKNGDTITVELDDDQNWSHIAKDQLIEIYGEIDKDMFSTKIDVKRATPVQ